MTGEWKGGGIETMYQLKATSKRGAIPPVVCRTIF